MELDCQVIKILVRKILNPKETNLVNFGFAKNSFLKILLKNCGKLAE